MATPYDSPFLPQNPATPLDVAPAAENTPGEANPDISTQWRSWMNNPNNNAALIQFGISLMQPVGLGQTPLGHLGSAVGDASQAITRREAEQQKQELQAANIDTKTAASTAKLAQAETASTKAASLAQYQQNQAENRRLQVAGHAMDSYIKYKAAIDKANSDPIRDPKAPKTPVPSYEEFLSMNPALAQGLPNQKTAPPGTSDVTAGERQFKDASGRIVVQRGSRFIYRDTGDEYVAQ